MACKDRINTTQAEGEMVRDGTWTHPVQAAHAPGVVADTVPRQANGHPAYSGWLWPTATAFQYMRMPFRDAFLQTPRRNGRNMASATWRFRSPALSSCSGRNTPTAHVHRELLRQYDSSDRRAAEEGHLLAFGRPP